jgi:hypothetical protein
MNLDVLKAVSNWPIMDQNGQRKVAQAVVFGLGSMFNHSTQDQNIVWQRDSERLIVTYRALRDIAAGEELCRAMIHGLRSSLIDICLGISYGSHLTFKDADSYVSPTEQDGLEQLSQIQLD